MKDMNEMDDFGETPMSRLFRKAIFVFGLSVATGIGAWVLLPSLPGGELAILLRLALTVLTFVITFIIGWFFSLLLSIEEMF